MKTAAEMRDKTVEERLIWYERKQNIRSWYLYYFYNEKMSVAAALDAAAKALRMDAEEVAEVVGVNLEEVTR